MATVSDASVKVPPPNTVWFYALNETTNPCRVFSNFAHFPFVVNGKTWNTTEHYFQAHKFVQSPEHFEAVAAVESPMDVARAGRDRSRPLRPDWEAVKDGIMLECVIAKFEQHPELAEILETTGDAYIVERTQNDRYWGDGGDGTGKNMLGHTLMQVRQLLRDKKSTSNVTAAPPPSAKKAE